MTAKGKRLFIIAVAGMVVIFVALFILSEFMAPQQQRPAQAKRPAQKSVSVTMEADDVIPELDEKKYPLPSVSLSRRLQEIALNKYVSNRLHETINLLELSVYLNSDNQLSSRRLNEVRRQLDRVVEEIVAQGNLDYKYLRYKRAIHHWEKVLNLIKDKESPVYQKTAQKIKLARKKIRK